MPFPTLTGSRVVLRPLAERDLDPLVAMVAHPSVRAWWGTVDDPAKLRDDFWFDGTAFAIDVAGELGGWLAVTEERDPDWMGASLDLLIAPQLQARGLGPEALRLAIRWLIDERGHHRCTIDPALDNKRAIRAYGAVGFRPVGILRQGERAPNGEWRDTLLMDLLAHELKPAPG